MSKRLSHKPTRETPAKEESRLRKENSELKRQVARLKKLVDQGVSTVPDIEPVEVEIPPAPKFKCKECQSTEFHKMSTPSGKVVVTCKGCRVRIPL